MVPAIYSSTVLPNMVSPNRTSIKWKVYSSTKNCFHEEKTREINIRIVAAITTRMVKCLPAVHGIVML